MPRIRCTRESQNHHGGPPEMIPDIHTPRWSFTSHLFRFPSDRVASLSKTPTLQAGSRLWCSVCRRCGANDEDIVNRWRHLSHLGCHSCHKKAELLVDHCARALFLGPQIGETKVDHCIAALSLKHVGSLGGSQMLGTSSNHIHNSHKSCNYRLMRFFASDTPMQATRDCHFAFVGIIMLFLLSYFGSLCWLSYSVPSGVVLHVQSFAWEIPTERKVQFALICLEICNESETLTYEHKMKINKTLK